MFFPRKNDRKPLFFLSNIIKDVRFLESFPWSQWV
jgi:hypothetical protein